MCGRPRPPGGAPRLLAVVRLDVGLPEPGEEGGDGLEGYALALLLGRVLAGAPLLKGLLLDHVLVVQSVKEHPQQVWGEEEDWVMR